MRALLRVLILFVVLILATVVLREPLLRAAGNALVESDSPKKADLAVVLAGDGWGNRVRLGGQMVRDGYVPQQNIVRRDGVRGALLTILKSGSASTLDVVARVKAAMPRILAGLPPGLDVNEFADQSLFVRAAGRDVEREGVIAAALTALEALALAGEAMPGSSRMERLEALAQEFLGGTYGALAKQAGLPGNDRPAFRQEESTGRGSGAPSSGLRTSVVMVARSCASLPTAATLTTPCSCA